MANTYFFKDMCEKFPQCAPQSRVSLEAEQRRRAQIFRPTASQVEELNRTLSQFGDAQSVTAETFLNYFNQLAPPRPAVLLRLG